MVWPLRRVQNLKIFHLFESRSSNFICVFIFSITAWFCFCWSDERAWGIWRGSDLMLMESAWKLSSSLKRQQNCNPQTGWGCPLQEVWVLPVGALGSVPDRVKGGCFEVSPCHWWVRIWSFKHPGLAEPPWRVWCSVPHPFISCSELKKINKKNNYNNRNNKLFKKSLATKTKEIISLTESENWTLISAPTKWTNFLWCGSNMASSGAMLEPEDVSNWSVCGMNPKQQKNWVKWHQKAEIGPSWSQSMFFFGNFSLQWEVDGRPHPYPFKADHAKAVMFWALDVRPQTFIEVFGQFIT